jgi:hypothetical protein
MFSPPSVNRGKKGKLTFGYKAHRVNFELATAEADTLYNLLDLDQESGMEDGSGELNVTEMSGTLCHALLTRLAFEVSVDG